MKCTRQCIDTSASVFEEVCTWDLILLLDTEDTAVWGEFMLVDHREQIYTTEYPVPGPFKGVYVLIKAEIWS